MEFKDGPYEQFSQGLEYDQKLPPLQMFLPGNMTDDKKQPLYTMCTEAPVACARCFVCPLAGDGTAFRKNGRPLLPSGRFP